MGNVVELKVDLDCEGCIKKILKAIKKIEGTTSIFNSTRAPHHFSQIKDSHRPPLLADIETYNVDKQLNKVTVTGNVTTEEVIKVLQKIGKPASSWEQE
ncbi:copper transport protein ATX1 isoform X1 [Diospyros lotus]|uniref:copper transport protein ATX1 isoform X1 n=1 Tax=Diospyros lotus TaxID=55363 RepID=UPI0022572EC3|nr:copper transport protein ATX1 isoform X1 [Diospyros lotus]